jgi:hypothetical protein
MPTSRSAWSGRAISYGSVAGCCHGSGRARTSLDPRTVMTASRARSAGESPAALCRQKHRAGCGLDSANGRPCDACGNAITLTAVEHEFGFADGRTVRFHDACSETWRRAISGHRGEEFCAKCLSAELFGGRDIDVPMRQVEGSGVRRFHGRCSVCGKLRLVATLPTRPAIGEAMGG